MPVARSPITRFRTTGRATVLTAKTVKTTIATASQEK